MRFIVTAAVLFSLGGCAVLTDVKLDDIPKFKYGECSYGGVRLGGPKTSQGDALCHALMGVKQRQGEISAKLADLSNQSFDYSLMGLAVLSVGAIAADAHVSVLEGLGITAAGVAGLRSYAGVAGRRSALARGLESLQCLDTQSTHLLWNDSSFYEMRSARKVLNASMAGIDSHLTDSGINEELRGRANDVNSAGVKARELADEAIQAYAALGGVVKTRRDTIVAELQGVAESSRGNVNEIVSSILSAERVKAERINGVEEKKEGIVKLAGKGTPTTSQAAHAQAEAATEIRGDANNAMSNAVATRSKALSSESGNSSSSKPLVAGFTSTGSLDKNINVLINKASNSEDRLNSAMAITAYSARLISEIAPQYITAKAGVEACKFK